MANQYVAVGIFGGFPGIRTRAGGTALDEVSSNAVTNTNWAFVACTFVSDTERRLYVNGELDSNFSTSRDINGQVTFSSLGVNRLLGEDTDADGSYQLFW